MGDFLERLRSREPHERKLFALGTSGVIVAILFVMWASTIGNRVEQPQQTLGGVVEVSPERQTGSVLGGVKRKASLLFGGNFLSGKVEYKQEGAASDESVLEEERNGEDDLQALLEAFNEEGKAEEKSTTTEDESL